MNRWSKSETLYNLKLEQIKKVYSSETEGYKLVEARLNEIFGK